MERDELDDMMDSGIERLQKGGGTGAVYGFKAGEFIMCFAADHVTTANEAYDEFLLLYELFKRKLNDPSLLFDATYGFVGFAPDEERKARKMIQTITSYLKTNG